MKKVIPGMLIACTLLMSQVSCIGSFGLTNKILEWNRNVSEKFVNELIFFVLAWFPVYSICIFIDAVILNSIEFWTGSNPVAMNEGDVEQQMVKGKDGKDYLITATQNKFEIKDMETEEIAELMFNPAALSWTATEGGETMTIIEGLKDESGKLTEEIVINTPNGQIQYDLNDNNLAGLQEKMINQSSMFAKN